MVQFLTSSFSWLRSNLLALGSIIIAILAAVIASLRRQKATMRADISKAQAAQLRHTQEALQEADREAEQLVQHAQSMADRGDLSDIK
jgi:hypothetical protein